MRWESGTAEDTTGLEEALGGERYELSKGLVVAGQFNFETLQIFAATTLDGFCRLSVPAGYAKVKERGQPTDVEVRLRKQNVKLKELRSDEKDELAQLRADREVLVRVVNQLTLENRQLRQQLTAPSSVVRLLPSQPQPPTG
ncbi:hypothetical protein [Streptomyces griseus]|uniref:hypothetical protein n=1 Tax=Streptomyces griseus TaxID=1911 RepID=UPI001EF228AD